MNDPLPDDTIELYFNESELAKMLPSDGYDFTTKDLTVCFSNRLLEKAKALIQQDPDLLSANYNAEISSASFEGLLTLESIEFMILFLKAGYMPLFAMNGWELIMHWI